MSISNLLVPNNYNLDCATIIQSDLAYIYAYLTPTTLACPSTNTFVQPFTNVYSNGGMEVTNTGTQTNFTITKAGKYFISFQLTIQANTSATEVMSGALVFHNTTQILYAPCALNFANTNNQVGTCTCTGIINCATGDYITVQAYNDSGSSYNVAGGLSVSSPYTTMTIYYLGL